MTEKIIKQRLRNDPNFAVNAVLDNNAADVASRLNSMGFSVSEDKHEIAQALAEIASTGDMDLFADVLSVRIIDENLNEKAFDAIYGHLKEVVSGPVPSGQVGFPMAFQTVDPVYDPDNYGNVNDLLDGLSDMDTGSGPASGGGGSSIDWGNVLTSVLPSIFDMFGGNNQDSPQNQNAYEAMLALEKQKAAQRKKLIGWIVLLVVLVIVGIIAFKAIKN